MKKDVLENLKDSAGFTVLELLVSLGLFALVVSIAVGSLVNAFRTQRQTGQILAVNSNVSLALEQIAREMRTGSDFCSAASCNGNSINFKNTKGELVTYCSAEGAIWRGNGIGACGGSYFFKLTSDEVNVQRGEFYVINKDPYPADSYQPRITISLGISPTDSSVSTNIVDIQTTISPRFPLDDGH